MTTIDTQHPLKNYHLAEATAEYEEPQPNEGEDTVNQSSALDRLCCVSPYCHTTRYQ